MVGGGLVLTGIAQGVTDGDLAVRHLAGGGLHNNHSPVDQCVESPPPILRLCMSIHPEGKPCSERGGVRVVVLWMALQV